MNEQPRAFVLRRDVDVTEVSGTGIVAWGVEFPDGVVALRWKSDWPSSVVFHDRGMAAVEAVHGHGGNTRIVFLAQSPATPTPGREEGVRCDGCINQTVTVGAHRSGCLYLKTLGQTGYPLSLETEDQEWMDTPLGPSPSPPQQVSTEQECEHNFQAMRHNFDFERCQKDCGAFKFRDTILVSQERSNGG